MLYELVRQARSEYKPEDFISIRTYKLNNIVNRIYYDAVLRPQYYSRNSNRLGVTPYGMNLLSSKPVLNRINSIFFGGSGYINVHTINLFTHIKQKYKFLNNVLDNYNYEFSKNIYNLFKFLNILLSHNNTSKNIIYPFLKYTASSSIFEFDYIRDKQYNEIGVSQKYKTCTPQSFSSDCYYYGKLVESEEDYSNTKDNIILKLKYGYFNNCHFLSNPFTSLGLINKVIIKIPLIFFGHYIKKNHEYKFIQNTNQELFGFKHCKMYVNDLNYLDLPEVSSYSLFEKLQKDTNFHVKYEI